MKFKFTAKLSVYPTLETMAYFLEWLKQPIDNPLKLGGPDGAGATDAVAIIQTDANGVVVLTLLVSWPTEPTKPQLTQIEGAIKVHLDSGALITYLGVQPDTTRQAETATPGTPASNGDQNVSTGSKPPYPV